MPKKTQVDIEVKYFDKNIDLKVPNKVSIVRLKELLSQNLMVLGIQLPSEWLLKIVDKNINVASYVPLDSYPIADGDKFIIEISEGKANDTSK